MSQLVAIVLAAGMGTRMKSAIPKALHEVLGRPMITYPIDVALETGADLVVVVLGHKRAEIEAVIRARYPSAPIAFALQEEQNGTGHAVLCALPAVPDDFTEVLVLNGDLPNLSPTTISRFVASAKEHAGLAAILTAELDDPSGYGRVIRGDDGRVLWIVEQADATEEQRAMREVNVGTYLFDASFLRDSIGKLTSSNAQNELYLTDLIARAKDEGEPALAILTHDQDEVSGVNHRADLARSEAIARRQKNRQLMLAGVTLIDPDRTYVEPDVVIAPDVTIWPGVVLRGKTEIATGVEIETGCVVIDSSIGPDTLIKPYCHLEGAAVGRGCIVGPFARLRPAAVLANNVHIGNYVEVKKTTIGEGSKANHLTYLGDAIIGSGVNVGAGTITCNYDGVNKHKTEIDDGAFIGSNTELVAPVKVGKNATVGAGSTITEDVPDGALGLGRARQKNIEGYVDRD